MTRDTVRLALAPALVFIVASLDRGYQTDYWQHLARGGLVAREGAVVSVDRFTYTAAGASLVDNNWLTQLLYHGLHAGGGIALVQSVNALVLAGAMAGLVGLCHRPSRSTGIAATAGVLAFFGLWPTFLIRPQSFSVLLFVALYALLLGSARRPRLLFLVPPMMALWANVHGGFAVGLVLLSVFALAAIVERLAPFLPLPLWERAGVRGKTPHTSCDESQVDPQRLPVTRHGGESETSQTQLFPLILCLAFSAAATLMNPYGWNVYRYAGRLSAIGVARGIEEWLPPSPTTPIGAAFFASLILLAVLVIGCRRRPTTREVCLLACFGAAASLSVRMTVWWHLAVIPVLARLAAEALLPRRDAEANGEARTEVAADRPSRWAAASLATLLGACVLSLPWLERFNPVLGTLRPAARPESDLQVALDRVAAGTADEDGARPRVFTRMEWANYVAWSTGGRCPVFVEGHVELYPDETWESYLTVTGGRPGWDGVLDRHAVDYLLLDEAYHWSLLSRVRESSQWMRRAQSGPAVLFERRRGGPALASPHVPGTVAGGDF
jgi:hypothetical protein